MKKILLRKMNYIRNNFTHKTVKHLASEYVRNELDIDGRVAFKVHTNTVEGFWSIVKRTVNGTHHWIWLTPAVAQKNIQTVI